MGSKRESNFVGSCRLLWVLIILSIPVILFSQARPAFTVNGVRAVNGTTLSICQGNRVTFENTTLTYETIRWRFDNGNPTQASSQQVQVRFDSLGTGKAVLIRTDFDGSVDSTWVFFSITNEFPVSSFDYNPKTLECGSLPFQFTDGSSGNGLGFVWNFGDGTSSTNRNPIHKFNKAIGATGNTSYSVRQIVTNSGGCKDTSVVQITVKNIPDISINSADPLVNFGPFNGIETFRYCNNVPFYTFQFRNISSTISAINGYTIKWGDGTPDTSFATWPGNVNINHTFPQGNSTMTVYVSGSSGCNNEKSYNVFVGSTPAGGFASPGNTEVCAPDSLKFVISGTANNPIGTIYTVTVNDGTPIKSFNHPAPDTVSHWFTKSSCGFSSSNGPNTFTNSFFSLLNIENPCGATSVNVIPIYVSGKPNPVAAISPGRNICVNVPAQIRNAGDFGGRITATGGGGSVCENKGRLVWEIFPSTGYSLSGGSLGNRNNRPVSGLDWTPGTETFNITFTRPGIYKVMQYMWNERCGLDSSELEICVRTPPAASFTMDKNEACAPDTLSLTNTSPIGACGGETYQWTIRYTDPTSCGGSGSYTYVNGTASNSTNPQISFGEAGLYIIELIVSTRASGCTPALFTDTFTVRQKPIVSINPLGRICAANTLSPAANVNTCYQNQGIIYEWAFTGGTPASSGSLNPGAVFYNTQGNFPIILKVTNDCGTTEANSQAIVGGRPDANAGPDRTVCSNEPVDIGLTGFTGVVYRWTPSRGLSNATIPNPTVNYPFYGPAADTTFQYVLTADAGVNCRSTDTVLVTIKRGPLLTVNPTITSVCIGGSVTLTANGADTYLWSPAAGLNDTQGAVVIASPVNTTLYTVTGSLANNCRASASVNVSVITRPVVNAGRDTVACNNAPNVILSGSPAGGVWSGNPFVNAGGSFNPRAAGNGIYTLYYAFIAAGCDGIDSMMVRVQNPPPSAAGRDTSICADGSIYQFTGAPIGGTWSGSTFILPNGDFTASTPGTYTLVYSVGSGSCIGRDTVVVTVVNAVSNNTISATQGLCGGVVPAPLMGSNATAGGLTLAYQWQQSADSLNWTNINGAIGKDLVIPVTANTIFYRRLASTIVCTAGSPSNVILIFIHPNALADIKPSPLVGCTPFAITPAVINLTAYPDRNSIYRWYANNGLIGTGVTFPGYTLSNSDDSIIIKLVTISQFGCVNDSASVKFKTISNPSPSFVLSDTVGCGPLNILVTNTTPQQQRYTFRWDFGNGQTSNNPQPGTILFAVNPNRGDTIYTVKLSATGGCDTFTVEHKIRVRARPRAIFTPDKAEGCSPFTVTLNNNSAGSNASFVWDFGDGSPLQPADFSSVKHTYFTGRLDTFRIRLYGTNDCGTDTARFNLVVNPNRVRLDFAVNGSDLNGCVPHTVNFFNNTIGANVFFWNFGDGSPVFTTNKGFDTVRHTFSDTGRFAVTLFASNGCSDTTSVETINVVKGPRVSFTLNPTVICLNQPFTLSNTSDAGLAWNWDFGDGTSSTLRDPLKNYTAAGSYRIVLRGSRQVAQGFNCTDSVVANLIVNAPTGNWRYRGGFYCPGQSAFFEVTNSNATRYKFFFGNGDSVVTASPSVSYVYPAPGAYMPRVELLYQGCTITLVGPDTIRMDKRQTGFTVQRQQFCGSTRVNFTDTSSTFFGIRQWSWLFGDGTTSILQNPVKVFTQSGTYAITLRVTGNSGCIDTTTRQVTIAVEQLPVISITGDSSACVGQPARFAAFDAANTTAVFDWQITGGGNQTGNEIFTTWPQSGTYALLLIGRTAFGCADTSTRSVRVNPTPVVNAGRDVTICRGQQIQLNATAPGSLLWTPQQGLSCNTCPNPIANPNFTTEYFLTNTNTFGCTGIDSMLVKVAQPFTLNVVPNDTICASRNESAQLFASNAIRYQWTPAVGLNANNIPNPVARPASTTTYRVVGFDVENCFTDTGYVTVGVGYNPTVSLPPGALVVAGSQVALTPALTGGPFARYTWTPNRDLSCNNCPGPVATINNTILYKLEVETIYGCIATDTVGYTVLCQKDQVFIPNAFSPDGDGVNDILMVRGKGVSTVKSFRIFNRYGQVVFEKQNFSANDPSAGWDGRINGVPASPDVYVFTAEVLCTAGANYTYKGNITLFR